MSPAAQARTHSPDAVVTLTHTSGRALRIAQITDTHLEQSQGGQLLGMDTDASLAHVLNLVRTAERPPDLVLATGDLANHGTVEAYLRVRERFDALGVPWFWLPGNHDDFGPMERALGRGAPMTRAVRTPSWQIVLLDSTMAGEVGGRLGDEELDLLDELLAQEPGRHALVCLHHPPVKVGARWLDEQRVADAAKFFRVIERHPQVRAVLWGHVHQEFRRRRKGVLLLATPSTCIQFAPNSVEFAVDEQPPGMRWLELADDGSVTTRVERVKGVEFHFDRNSTGYL